MSILIDETIILRYLLADDDRAYKRACAIIETREAYTRPEIIARVAVTLRDVHRVPRKQIGYSVITLLDDISVVDEAIVRYAARLFGSSMMDFTDCILVACNALLQVDVESFDKPLMQRTMATLRSEREAMLATEEEPARI